MRVGSLSATPKRSFSPRPSGASRRPRGTPEGETRQLYSLGVSRDPFSRAAWPDASRRNPLSRTRRFRSIVRGRPLDAPKGVPLGCPARYDAAENVFLIRVLDGRLRLPPSPPVTPWLATARRWRRPSAARLSPATLMPMRSPYRLRPRPAHQAGKPFDRSHRWQSRSVVGRRGAALRHRSRSRERSARIRPGASGRASRRMRRG